MVRPSYFVTQYLNFIRYSDLTCSHTLCRMALKLEVVCVVIWDWFKVPSVQQQVSDGQLPRDTLEKLIPNIIGEMPTKPRLRCKNGPFVRDEDELHMEVDGMHITVIFKIADSLAVFSVYSESDRAVGHEERNAEILAKKKAVSDVFDSLFQQKLWI